MEKQEQKQGREQGFTLIELLVAIVVVGILTAVAIVGIAGLQNNGSKGACLASRDAASAAMAVHFANTQPSAYPKLLDDMANASPQEWVPPTGVAIVDDSATASHITTNGWTLSMDSSTTPPTLTCTP